MRELERTLIRLRLLLSEIKGKEDELQALRGQLEGQLKRAPSYAVFGQSDISRSLTMMEEMDERLRAVERKVVHLRAIRQRAEQEITSLTLLKQAEDAKAELAKLQEKARTAGCDAAELTRIQELEITIAEAGERAAASITVRAATDRGEPSRQ